jgi:hypothetical protein
MASLADERASKLTAQLELHSTSLLSTDATAGLSDQAGKISNALRLLKAKSHRTPAPPKALAHILNSVNEDRPDVHDAQQLALAWFANSQLTIECYRTVLHSLFEDAARLIDAIEYWRGVETRSLGCSSYLLQSAPVSIPACARLKMRQPSLSGQRGSQER